MDLTDLTIKEIKKELNDLNSISDDLLQRLEDDSRKGVQKLAQRVLRQQKKEKEAKAKFKRMSKYELSLRNEGYRLIGGIDEAGRGPLAGPVVASVVILPHNIYIPGLDDSKKLSEKKREELFDIIYDQAIDVGVGIVDNRRIDQINILQATYQAMIEAIGQLKEVPEYLLVDAETIPQISIPQRGIINGDRLSISIAAASIIAKVTRDRILVEYDQKYPEYNLASHKGYGTREHIDALKEHGPTDIHRRSFKIVKELI